MTDVVETSGWIDAGAADDVVLGGCSVVRNGPKQIAVFRLAEDRFEAIDNRCPHEGYPLKTGTLKDGLLTCEWHNWKFRLQDGACLIGGEDVRHYPLRIDDGRIRIDVTDPPAEEALPAVEASLLDSFDELDWARAARDIERLLAGGRTPEHVLGLVCSWSASHAKYGFDHGPASAADLATLLDHAGPDADIVLLRAAQSAVQRHVRRPARVFPDPAPLPQRDGGPDWAAVGEQLAAHVEAQELEPAEALTRGAIEAGVEPATAFGWTTRMVTDHFLDFAHQHIYTVKCEELLARIGWQHAHPVLTSHITGITYATREDLLPYMRAYRNAMGPHEGRMETWAQQAADPEAEFDAAAFALGVLDGDLEVGLDAVAAALDARVAPARIACALGAAAALRILRFDARIEWRSDVKQSWLWVTHTLTHVDALAESLRRHPGPAALRALFHSVRFINHVKVLDGDTGFVAPDTASSLGASDLLDALAAHDVERAMTAAASGLAREPEAVEAALYRSCTESPLVRPIFFQHHVKTVMAAIRLARRARDLHNGLDPDLPILAVVRLLAHPLRELNLGATAKTARAFVYEGKLPGSLLPY